MPIQLPTSDINADGVAVVYSPALEAVLSLHILVEPKHHPLHHQWVREARRRLPADMKRLIAGFRFAHTNYVPPVLLPSPLGDFPGFESELERLRELGPKLGGEILRYFVQARPDEWAALSEPEIRASILRRTAGLGSATRELVRIGVDSPQELADRFLDFLSRYWHEGHFEAEWARIEPMLVSTVTDVGKELAEHGLRAWLGRLRPKVGIDRQTGELSVEKAINEQISVPGNARFVLAPSAFMWPHIGVVHDPPHAVGLIYPAPFSRFNLSGEPETDRLVGRLRALADPTRIQAMRLISRQPRSTQELASLLKLGEAAVSKHLHKLVEAELLETRRDGYYVLYELVSHGIDRLSAELVSFLQVPEATVLKSTAGEGAVGALSPERVEGSVAGRDQR